MYCISLDEAISRQCSTDRHFRDSIRLLKRGLIMSMLPRLQPRPRRTGLGNKSTLTELTVHSSRHQLKTVTLEHDLMDRSKCEHDTVGTTENNLRPPLSRSQSFPNASISQSMASPAPAPTLHLPNQDIEDLIKTPIRNADHHKHILDCTYTSSSVDSSFSSDITLTPPATTSQPLAVAAKRHSSDIREANDRKRRRRRRRQYSKNLDFSSILPRAATNQKSTISVVGDNDGNDIAVDGTTALSIEEKMSLSDFQANMMSPEEKTKKYWEWCYGKGTVFDESISSRSFSANRMPPSKGW
jgi:hypothetical protein